MPEKDPLSYSLFVYLYVFGISALAGIVNYIGKISQGRSKVFCAWELIGEIVTSVFVGVMTFYICEASGVEPLLSAALIGLTSHMGTRAIIVAQRFFAKKFGITEE
jgi:uncharacterized membrane protein (DUF4010 family)